jgi:hypothetical protein
MDAFFSSGHIVDLILAVIVLEAAILIGRYRLTSRGLSPGELIPSLIPGAFLLLAVRTALTESWWGWSALALAAAGVAHATDIALRLLRSRP